MMTRERTQRFARAEHVTDTAVHAVGVMAALAAVPVLIYMSVTHRGGSGVTAAVAVYGVSLLAMLVSSAIYNVTGPHRFSHIFKRMDHTAIFLKIAGTFTPLVVMTGGAGALYLSAIWAVALGGSSLKILAPDSLRWLGLTLYLGLGWLGVIFGQDIFAAMTPGAVQAVTLGGLIYTAGVAFFLWERLPFHTAIWHLFVLVATGFLYAAMYIQIAAVPERMFIVG